VNGEPTPQTITAKAALVAIKKLQARLDALEGARTEPIAIVGIGCRFPGRANTPDSFWSLLCKGVDAVTEVPRERWDVDEYYDPDPSATGRMSTRWGSFLESVDRFDPQFFGLSPREAASMDPQQRLLLEVAWEALEDAAIPPDRLAGSRAGVFVGMYNNDYAQLQLGGSHADAHQALGSALGIAPGRLSYVLDLQGPSLLVDTLCSSSAVAVHLACLSLRSQDCTVALAGGVNLTLSPFSTITTSRLLALSPDGRCRTFDARANGYVRGEGCAVVVLKRLSDALKDGDPVWAIIRGSAVNQDGRSTGLTAPNVRAQQEVVRQALANAGVAPDEVGYIEAHGTGTPLGDPIEFDALRAVYGRPRADGRSCALGSVKTNLGHLEAAAGIAGLLKAVLVVRHGAIPPHLHFRRLNPRISLTGTPFFIPTALTEWASGAVGRVAGVSSFGLSGTNAHLVVAEPPADRRVPTPADDRPCVLTLSARTDGALREQTVRYRDYLRSPRAISLPDVCFTSQAGRSHFEHRLAVVAEGAGAAAALLDDCAAGHLHTRTTAPPKLAFLFTGQGAQYPGMGRGLYAAEPRFRAAIDECAAMAQPLLDIPLSSLLFDQSLDERQIHRTSYTQVALFALEWGLAQLWMSWGVKPDLVLGHSFGEYVAACLAGAFGVEDGLKLVAMRGQLMQSVGQAGSMATIFAPRADVDAALARTGAAVAVASVNAPSRIVISGPRDAVEAACAEFNARGVETRLLAISQASHSALMDPILDEFERAAALITARPLTMPLVSNLTGEVVSAGTTLDARYWRRHLRETVQLSRGIETLAARGCEAYLEIGPHPTLASLGPHVLPDANGIWLPSLHQDADDRRTMLDSLGRLYVAGLNPDWGALYGEGQRRIGSLPTYPFQRERHWARRTGAADVPGIPTGDPLLGVRLRSALPQTLFESRLSVDAVPWLDDHRVQGHVVLPAAAIVAMARSAAVQIAPAHGYAVTDVVIREPLLVPDERSVTTQVVLVPREDGVFAFQLHSLDADRWRLHAEATVCAGQPMLDVDALERIRERCGEDVPVDAFYDELRERGLEYGPAFRGLARMARNESEAVAHLVTHASEVPLLDACFQLLGVLLTDESHLYLPLSIERLSWWSSAPQSGWVHARIRASKAHSDVRIGDVTLYGSDGRPALTVEGLALGRLQRALTGGLPIRRWLHVLEWRAQEVPPLPEFTADPGRWLIIADAAGCGARLADLLRRIGQEPVVLDTTSQLGTVDVDCRTIVYLSGLDDSLESATRRPLLLVQAVLAQRATPRICWVTRGAYGPSAVEAPHQAALWGFVSALAREHPELPSLCFDLDPGLPAASSAAALLASVLAGDAREVRQALRGGRVHVPRLVPMRPSDPGDTPVRLEASASGELEQLHLASFERREPAAGEIEVRVEATGLNFRDVLKGLGLFPGDRTPPGFECAGRVVSVGYGVHDFQIGDRVVAIAPASIATHVTVPSALAALIPANLSTIAAATLPVVFLTARFALSERACLRAGERVLIHSGAGGVGLAAIQWARQLGARVYATAGNEQKRAVLEAMNVPVVGSSRSLPSADEMRRAIGDAGVDVVLNALSGEGIERSLRLLAPGGRFVELGRRGIWSPEQVAAVRPDVAYHVLDLPEVAAREPERAGRWLRELMDAFAAGELRSLPIQTCPLSDASRAFRTMAQGQHIGKLAILVDSPPQDIRIRPEGHYLISGGRGGVALALARWLVDQGARHVILASRRPPDLEQRAHIDALVQAGADVTAIEVDVGDCDALRALLPPLSGVIHAAAVLDDGPVIQQTWERMQAVLSPKVAGAWALHRLTEGQPLDFFIVCSSAASVLGSAGQTAYAAANAFLDGLAAWRRGRGEPGLSINWGPVADVGRAAQMAPRVRAQWAAAGIDMLPSASLGPAVIEASRAGSAQVVALAADWTKLRMASADPLLAEPSSRRPRTEQTSDTPRLPLPDLVRAAAATVLGLSSDADLPADQPLRELGLDSLMAVELRNRLARELDRSLPATLAFDYPTVSAIVSHLAGVADAASPAVREVASAPSEPIAIVGMGCRIPGGTETPDDLWRLVAEGVDAIREVPHDRWDVDAYYHPEPGTPGKMSTRWAGVVDGIDRFDAGFFGVSPREAASMDPQHRMLLEVTWEALERAGIAPDRLAGSLTGVFVGISTADYSWLQMRAADPGAFDVYVGTGNAVSVAAGRIAYVLGLQGPCVALDTACSSSLTAMHLACQSLRLGECDLAVAGGVNAILTPDALINFSQARMMAADGRCKTFDASADGFVRGEGCGMLVLKRVSDARRDGDPIVAVIRGSAVNQDGRSNGLTAPNGPSQVAVIRAALTRAGVAPHEVGYVEAHGTGTALGDPIEMQAIGAVMSVGRDRNVPLLVGSIKSNVGHLEAAAGVAGVMKAALGVQHRQIAPSLHFRNPSPHIPWDRLPVRVPTELTPWPASYRSRIAGVSGFGISGTNAHVVLEEAPALPAAEPTPDRTAHLLAVSAKSPDALRDLTARYARYLEEQGSDPFADVCHTASTGRSHFAHRLAVVASSREGARQQLSSAFSGAAGGPPKVAFLFAGQGSQYAGMGRQLYEGSPTFRAALDRCADILAPLVDVGLIDLLYGQGDRLQQTRYAQPALVAFEWALADLWHSWGIVPDAVLGHSVGECAAACRAGVLSIEDALRLAAARGRLMEHPAGRGAMTTIFADAARVGEAAKPFMGRVVIGAVNGRMETVISGEADAVREIEETLTGAGVTCRRMAMEYAFHSPVLESMLDPLQREAASLSYANPHIPVVSSLTGQWVDGDAPIAAPYWSRQARAPVQFSQALDTLLHAGHTAIVEIGPTPTLLAIAQRHVEDDERLWLPTLRKGRDDWEQILESLARIYTNGAEVDWVGFDKDYRRRRVVLPTYPFRRERHWVADVRREPFRTESGSDSLLGRRVSSPALDAAVFETLVSATSTEMLRDHRIYGAAVMPAAGYAAQAVAAAREALAIDRPALDAFAIHEPLVLRDGETRVLQAVVKTVDTGFASFEVHSRAAADGGAAWTLHATAKIRTVHAGPSGAAPTLSDIRERSRDILSGAELYAHARERDIEFGPSFQVIDQIWRGEGEALARIAIPPGSLPDGSRSVSPGLIDACFQLLAAASPGSSEEVTPVPVGFGSLRTHGDLLGVLWAEARVRDAALFGDVRVFNEHGVQLEIEGIRLQHSSREFVRSVGQRHSDLLFEVAWQNLAPAPDSGRVPAGSTWMLVADRQGLAEALGALLDARGVTCVLMQRDDHPLAIPRDCQGVVYLAGLDVTAPDDQEPVCGGALRIVQAVAAAGPPAPRIWIVTAGAQSGLRPAHGTLWGFGRTVRLEQPEVWGGLVDLDPELPLALQADAVLAELSASDREREVAYRAGRRHVSRLRPCSVPEQVQPLELHRDGTYLITGGCGALGLHVARRLSDRGAGHLMLLGRSQPTAAAQRAIDEIRASSTDVQVVCADVSIDEDVAGALGRIAATLPPLRGIVHAAGVLDDVTLARLDWDRFERVLAPKVRGAWNLHTQTRDLPLDFFVLFSSLASAIGSPGQANYAAANAFLDSLAVHRRQLGLPALAVDWAAWAEGGMASERGHVSRRRGLWPIRPEDGLDVLETCMAGPAGQVCVVAAEWPRFLEQIPDEYAATFFAHVDAGRDRRRQSDEHDHALRRRLQSAAGAERDALLLSHVRTHLVAVLNLPADAGLDSQQGFFDLGMDSLMATELRNRLQSSLGIGLPVTVVLEHGNLAALAAHLAQVLSPPPEQSAAADASADEGLDGLLSEVERLSDVELDRALAAWTGTDRGVAS
jgi:acyl transferase domain-containing protein/NADPH:quinone reductase-like Zn-dependent oxidoreductase/acyl carrier protein